MNDSKSPSNSSKIDRPPSRTILNNPNSQDRRPRRDQIQGDKGISRTTRNPSVTNAKTNQPRKDKNTVINDNDKDAIEDDAMEFGEQEEETARGESTTNAKGKTLNKTSSPFCYFCRNRDHFSDKCHYFPTLPARTRIVRLKGLCIRCLRKRHPSNCPSTSRCFHCSKAHLRNADSHHTALCHVFYDA